jgi:hypothetical protein
MATPLGGVGASTPHHHHLGLRSMYPATFAWRAMLTSFCIAEHCGQIEFEPENDGRQMRNFIIPCLGFTICSHKISLSLFLSLFLCRYIIHPNSGYMYILYTRNRVLHMYVYYICIMSILYVYILCMGRSVANATRICIYIYDINGFLRRGGSMGSLGGP